MFSCQLVVPIMFSLATTFLFSNAFALAQISNPNVKNTNGIQQQVLGNQQVQAMCKSIKNIKFELEGDELLIITGDQSCSHTIMQQVLYSQVRDGKFRTYEFALNGKDIIVRF